MAYSPPFPEEVLEHVFSFILSDRDRNAVSLVCKSWYDIERQCRRRVFIGNCYAVNPSTVLTRFPELRCVELKGKPHFADFNLVPDGWGGYVHPWVEELAKSCPGLEELRLKRMVVSDEALEILARKFRNFRVLVMSFCDGFGTNGLAAIAENCRSLQVLDLRECEVDDLSGNWLGHFPKNFTSLASLNISCLSSELSLSALERLVSRCPNIKSLKLNRNVPLERLPGILRLAPGLVELGTGSCTAEHQPNVYDDLLGAFSVCKELRSLSGFWDAVPASLAAVYPVCAGLTSLNMSEATIKSPELIKLISQCPNLQRLHVMDFIEDSGLSVVAATCKNLRELRVFPSDPFGLEPNVSLTEDGLVSVSEGCTKLQSVLYFCRQMSNAALMSVARNSPHITRFRLCILDPRTPDHITSEPLDKGFGAVVERCKGLKRLSLSGLLTDRVFEAIGQHAKKLEMLSVAFAGESDTGLHHLLSGCENLRKLEIRDCPFGDGPLLANAAKLNTMRSLWMSSCAVTLGACRLLGQQMPLLNVEVINEDETIDPELPNTFVEKLYIYRTLAGRRHDSPNFVWTM
uniref:F-box domain-containing protein n=1 Tax=Kalanchoe fedtschenkoi TaxID=63787 RepID=A0A7N1A7W4_KALFE